MKICGKLSNQCGINPLLIFIQCNSISPSYYCDLNNILGIICGYLAGKEKSV